MFWIIVSLIAVGFLWGATNPFIKVGSKGVENIIADSQTKKIFLELKFLFTRPSYLIPFLLNQLGSVLYVFTLQSSNLSLAVPVANSISFIFTAISGYILGEDVPTKSVLLGGTFIAFGSGLIIYDKLQ